jgi:chaperonin GroES
MTLSAKKEKQLTEGFSVLKPLGDRVIVELVEEPGEQTVGGIVLATTLKKNRKLARVVAVGAGRVDTDDGKQVCHYGT